MPITKLPAYPQFTPQERSERLPPLVWRAIAELNAKVNEVIDALGGLSSGDYVRSNANDSFDSGVVTSHNGAFLATANNASANIAARWFEVSDGSTGPGDGADFFGEWGGGPSNNVRRIANVAGALAFTKLSGTDASGAQYTFDGQISATDLLLSASITNPTAYTVSSPPTQAEVSAILTTVKDIYNAVK